MSFRLSRIGSLVVVVVMTRWIGLDWIGLRSVGRVGRVGRVLR